MQRDAGRWAWGCVRATGGLGGFGGSGGGGGAGLKSKKSHLRDVTSSGEPAAGAERMPSQGGDIDRFGRWRFWWVLGGWPGG